jgi:hypothetical protein
LKRKHGGDYQSKLTDLNIDEQFIKQINLDINIFNEKESFKSSNYNMQEINNCLRSLSPKNFVFSGEYHPKKKPFSAYTKKSPDFLDSNIQYGGESQVLKALKKFNGIIKKNYKSPLSKHSAKNNINNSSNNNFCNFGNAENLHNNDERYDNESQRDGKVSMSNSHGYRSYRTKLNSDFFINNEITNELLRRPLKVGIDSYGGKFNSRKRSHKNYI